MTNNDFATIDLALLDNVSGGEGQAGDQTGQPASTWIGCAAQAGGNAMQGQPLGKALHGFGQCVQTGQPIPAYNPPARRR